MTSTSTVRSLVGVAAAGALFLAACGGSDDASDAEVADTAAPEQPAADAVDAEPVGIVETAPVDITGEALPVFGDPTNDPAVGAPSPVLSGVSFDGTPVTIGGPTENLTLVVFLAHWCPACNEEIPELVALAEADAYPEGVDVVAVSTAVAEDRDNYPPSDWFDDEGWPFPVMADDSNAAGFLAFGGNAFPFLVVLDTDGTVLLRKAGQSSGAETVMLLEAVLAVSTG